MTKGRMFGLIVVALVFGLVGLWRVSKARCFQLVGAVACRVTTEERVVALSFDDGPTPEGVDAVLKPLRDRGVKATFFLIGEKMARHPGQAERLAAEGHELGNHSYSHVRMVGRSAADYDREIRQTDALLRQAGEPNPTLLRPPFGKRLWGFPVAAERAGYRMIMWDVEDDAEHYPEPKLYARHILDQVQPGSIILIHPMYRTNATAQAALPLILDGLAAKGYRITTVSELLKMSRAT